MPAPPQTPEQPLGGSGRANHLHRNIPLYYLGMFFRNFWFSMPIHILYYQARGLSFVQMGAIEAVISVVILLSDVPSGALADIFGRRFSTFLGYTFWGVSLIMTAMSARFPVFVIAGIIMGLGDSLLSGADTALFYDTLKEMGKDALYIKYIGRRDILTSMAIIIAAISGALLYQVNITLPFYAQGLGNLIAACLTLAMVEPTQLTHQKSVTAQYRLIIDSLKFTWNTRIVRFFTVFYVLVLMIPMGFVNLLEQPYLVSLSIPVAYFGVIYALTRGVIGLFAPARYAIERKLGERGSFYAITGIFAVMFLLMAVTVHPIGAAWLFILFFTRDYTWTIMDKYANDHIPSERRATVLSIMNFAVNGIYTLLAIFIGFGMDHFQIGGLPPLTVILAIFCLFFVIVVFPLLFTAYRSASRAVTPPHKPAMPHPE